MRNNIYNINFGEYSHKSYRLKIWNSDSNLVGYWVELAISRSKSAPESLIFQTNKEKDNRLN